MSFLTVNTVYYRVNSLGKCTPCCMHPDCVVPELAAADAAQSTEENDMYRTQWDPFEELRGAQDELNPMIHQMSSLLAQALGQRQAPAASSTPAWAPALDISERKDAYLVTVELPGVKLDDLQITVEDTLLTIQGERHFAHDSSEQQYHRVERRYGAFRRSITLPAHVMADMVEASFEDGVLQIVVPKAEEAKPKRIQVRPGGEREAIEATPPTS